MVIDLKINKKVATDGDIFDVIVGCNFLSYAKMKNYLVNFGIFVPKISCVLIVF